MKKDVEWMEFPEEHNYPAALSYLTLLYPPDIAQEKVDKLRRSDMSTFKAKDIFRASRLPLLGISNDQIKKNMKKIKECDKLSPLLLVRDSLTNTLIIADGYHRICAIYMLNEDVDVPCKII